VNIAYGSSGKIKEGSVGRRQPRAPSHQGASDDREQEQHTWARSPSRPSSIELHQHMIMISNLSTPLPERMQSSGRTSSTDDFPLHETVIPSISIFS
jgi:hypothetical protein